VIPRDLVRAITSGFVLADNRELNLFGQRQYTADSFFVRFRPQQH